METVPRGRNFKLRNETSHIQYLRSRGVSAEYISVSMDDRHMDNNAFYGRGAGSLMSSKISFGELTQPVVSSQKISQTETFGRSGIADPWGRIILIAFAMLLLIISMLNLSTQITESNVVNSLRRDVDTANSRIEDLNAELQAKEDSINVGYQAAQMGMVSSKSANVIYLTAPGRTENAQSVSGSGSEQLALIMGD